MPGRLALLGVGIWLRCPVRERNSPMSPPQSQRPDPWGSEATSFFYELTPERVLDAVESIGLEATGRMIALASMENRVYQVEIEDPPETMASGGGFVVAKFYRPGRWSKEQILEEHRFLADLVEAEVPVVAPLPLPGGETLVLLEELGIFFALFPRVGGRAPEDLTPAALQQLGRLVARVHNVGQLSEAPSRVRLDPISYGRDNLEQLISMGAISPAAEQRYRDVVLRTCDSIEPLFEAANYLPRIHGDFHPGNILRDGERFVLLDFDDMVRGPAMQDLWLVVPGRDAIDDAARNELFDGYEQLRSFDYSEVALIEPLRALRMIHFDAWIARRYDDPSFQRAFPDFGDDRYWFTQVADLSDQLGHIEEVLARRQGSYDPYND
jgi:Ser/Thr protein kinase RdoA (MazF antagonist)